MGTGCSATTRRGRPSAQKVSFARAPQSTAPPRALQAPRSKRSSFVLIRASGPSGDGHGVRDVNVMVGVARGRHKL